MKNLMTGLAVTTMIFSASANTISVNTINANAANNIVENKLMFDDIKFADAKINDVYQQYISLKTALVNNDLEQADMGVKMLNEALTKAKINSKFIGEMMSATDVRSKRNQFSPLSVELAAVFKDSKIESGIIYKQFCPMANQGKGGYWLASESKIQNPYYGKQMMSCGSVKEEIK